MSTEALEKPVVEAAETTQDLELEEALAELRRMIETSRVLQAREFVKTLEERWPECDRVRHWARVLAPPVWRRTGTSTGRPLEKEHAWLRAHAHEHPGCWIGLHGDRVLAIDPELANVLAVTRSDPSTADAVLFYMPDRSAW